MLRMQIRNILRTNGLRLGNSHFGTHKVPLRREIEIGTVTVIMVVIMAAITSPWTSRKNLTSEEAVVSKAVVVSNNNIKAKVADKNNMLPLSTSSLRLTLETTIISKIPATLLIEKSCSLLSKIGSTKGSRVILTTAEVDKVAEIDAKTTKVVTKVEAMAVVMAVVMAAVVEEEVADVEKAISIIMTASNRLTPKTMRRAKNRQIRSLLQKRHAWKRRMLTKLSKS